MKTNVQLTIDARRALYQRAGSPTLLQQCVQFHRLTYREFAKVFDISLSHAESIIKHNVFPSLELGVRIARYFECMVEDLFGWRIDDDGKRCPLIVEDPKSGIAYRLNDKVKRSPNTLDMIRKQVEENR